MKKIGIIALAATLYCGAASAQGPDNIVAALLGPTGPVQGLVQSLQQRSLEPLVNGLVHTDTGLIQGQIAEPLNGVLIGVLDARDPTFVINNLTETVRVTLGAVAGGLGNKGLGRIVLGPNALVQVSLLGEAGEGPVADLLASLPALNVDNVTRPLVGGLLFGSGVIAGGGQGMSPQEIPLADMAPAARSALINNVSLPGL